jgi:hypothetical protein
MPALYLTVLMNARYGQPDSSVTRGVLMASLNGMTFGVRRWADALMEFTQGGTIFTDHFSGQK